ncbi:voltage-dependent calcium channel beta subunit-associated regulatory protein isoform X1 [Electrophorus electricus]|uniref:voltage-dependent calcium channel beta subunit-associated regulatory protein isoform X1 n=1 Tax=Electrophorus electricus TaxID=8005 RepID=UPI0015CFEF74|nr:voltage-dependent calcium channel beta subunit-associated regulatory protein isoform X1 [Electrophorus electricus]XP_035379256.1 voltage-dependent calcium channel beta subunit-associated regulatory protein isoform X1 [Electrophorus electricus]
MSNESAVWNNLTESATELPLEPGVQDGAILLLVLLSIFLGGTLVLVSVLLITCRRCCDGDRLYAQFILCFRARDDPEKITTPYLEETQPVHEITIRVDEVECVSAGSSHDEETERFLSTGTTGRRVSFNEAALFDHGKKAQEKGRRYTLTEGDFHHLKNARLTHLHLPPSTLKIVTIHECETAENSIAMATRPVTKSSLSIFQPLLCPVPQTALISLSGSPSSALPGDTLNSTVDTTFCESPPALGPEPPSPSLEMLGTPTQMEMRGARNGGSPGSGRERLSVSAARPCSLVSGPQGPVVQFFTKLRRHASLEGASPYFKIKRWRFGSSQRASSLDTRGSPKRRPFQRQRAASESTDQDEPGTRHIDLIQYIARTKDVAYCPSRSPAPPPPRLLSPTTTPPPSLGRLEVEVMVEPSYIRATGPGAIGTSAEPQDEALGVCCRQDSMDPQSLYRDIWTLRASLEKHVSSDQSSNNDKDSVHSDADSVCSLRMRTVKMELRRHPSQDIGDGTERDGELSRDEALEKPRKQDSWDSERGSDGESGTRKLLQMDSGYASIEAPCRTSEEAQLLYGIGEDGSAGERRRCFTSSGHRGTVCESFDTDIFDEELEEEPVGASGGSDGVAELDEGSMVWSPYGQMFTQPDRRAHVPPLSRRDYSIDEKTDALFHEFLRHDPQFDQQGSPLRPKHRSRVHLRKQWQRSKQHSDPGQRFHTSFDRYRVPLRRGETVNYPLESSYHSTLPRIVSAPDEENSEGSAGLPDTPKTDQRSAASHKAAVRDGSPSTDSSGHSITDSTTDQPEVPAEESGQTGPPSESAGEFSPPQLSGIGCGPQTVSAELSGKLAASLEERLYSGLHRSREQTERTLTATHASPDHSPV